MLHPLIMSGACIQSAGYQQVCAVVKRIKVLDKGTVQIVINNTANS